MALENATAIALSAENILGVWPAHYQHDIPTAKVQENFMDASTFTSLALH